MAEPAIQELKNCYSKQIMLVYSKTATEEKIFIYYPLDKNILLDTQLQQSQLLQHGWSGQTKYGLHQLGFTFNTHDHHEFNSCDLNFSYHLPPSGHHGVRAKGARSQSRGGIKN